MLVEGAVEALRGDELAFSGLGRQLGDDLSAGRAGHAMLTPHGDLGVAGLVSVVREDDHPALAPGVVEEPSERRHDRLRARIGQRAVDEVVQHVDDDQGFHP